MTMEEAMKHMDFLGESMKYLNTLDSAKFLSMMCVMMEEYCLNNDQDAVEMAQYMARAVKEVNEIAGRYGA